MAKGMRINIPTNPDQLIRLAKNITNKHTADGTSSPLTGLDMADFAAKTVTADTENVKSAQLRRDAEAATQKRDNALGADGTTPGTVAAYVRSVRDMLAGLKKGNEQQLGDWGFDVDASPRSGGATPPSPTT
ncbi:MAG: hypothetical protein WDM76_03965 [Limisphaerales bacterium]